MITYFITGGAGSLGKALTHSFLKNENARVIIYSRDEAKHFLAYADEIKQGRVISIIGDVRDYDRLRRAILLYKPEYIIHAAAYKRIDDMEYCPIECIRTNVHGTENIASAVSDNVQILSNLRKVLLISTDKACKPVNVYGSSKMIAERIFAYYGTLHTKLFTSVRYGNVLASRGSFIPSWVDMIKNNKPVAITSLECSRFLFTLEDAVKLVEKIIYGKNTGNGCVYIPTDLKSYTLSDVYDVVYDVVKHLYPEINSKSQYKMVGMRPGEKLHEDLIADTEVPMTYYDDDNHMLCVFPQIFDINNVNFYNFTKCVDCTPVATNSDAKLSHNKDELYSLIIRGIQIAQ
jgi:FlaA1/EpsC-like NDP-sugar epimerase